MKMLTEAEFKMRVLDDLAELKLKQQQTELQLAWLLTGHATERSGSAPCRELATLPATEQSAPCPVVQGVLSPSPESICFPPAPKLEYSDASLPQGFPPPATYSDASLPQGFRILEDILAQHRAQAKLQETQLKLMQNLVDGRAVTANKPRLSQDGSLLLLHEDTEVDLDALIETHESDAQAIGSSALGCTGMRVMQCWTCDLGEVRPHVPRASAVATMFGVAVAPRGAKVENFKCPQTA